MCVVVLSSVVLLMFLKLKLPLGLCRVGHRDQHLLTLFSISYDPDTTQCHHANACVTDCSPVSRAGSWHSMLPQEVF